ncbi:MAG: hypothetical protein IJW70_05085 [Clostridia bacterium]|nr:hypothetical protein [Clostridia bacterium]
MMKKAIAWILLTVTLLAALAACAESSADQEGDSSIAEESTDLLYLDNIPEDLKFNGEDIVILNRELQGWTADEVAVPELNSEPVNDAMFNRNVAIADRLGINIVSAAIQDPEEQKPIDEIKRAVKAGSDEYDMVAAAAYVTAPAMVEGTFIDLTQLNYLDLSMDYWMQDYNEAVSYQGMQHSATGMIALSTYRFVFVTMFNKDAFDDKSVPYLYEAVANNEWTLDYQASLAEDFYQDINGSSKADEGDFYGFVSCWGISVDAYWASCDLPIVQKNENGEYEYVLDLERYSGVMDKVLYLFYGYNGTDIHDPITYNVEQDNMREIFSRGECAMVTLRLMAVEQPDMRNMEQQYGIVPMPKYDTAQPEYGSVMHDQFTVFAVPASAASEKYDMIGAAMEAMASESLRLVKPAYYEIALKRKYMSDLVACEMLDLVFATMRTDPSFVYITYMGSPHHTMRNIAQSKRNTVASSCKKLGNTVQKQISKLQKKLDKLGE